MGQTMKRDEAGSPETEQKRRVMDDSRGRANGREADKKERKRRVSQQRPQNRQGKANAKCRLCHPALGQETVRLVRWGLSIMLTRFFTCRYMHVSVSILPTLEPLSQSA